MTAKPSLPWSLTDLRLLVLSTSLGVGGIIAAWWGSSGTAHLHQQAAWTVVAIAATGCVVLGDLLWLSSAHRAIQQRHDAMLEAVDDCLAEPRVSSTPQRDSGLVALAAGSRYHRIDCLLVTGKRTKYVQVAAGETGPLQPCEMCLP